MSIVWYFVALVVLIALSAFFSASEMSYSSANRLRLENAAEDGSRRARAAVGILDHYDSALSAILIGNNLVNIASSSLGSVIVILLAATVDVGVHGRADAAGHHLRRDDAKIVAKQNANGIALRNAYVIRALSIVLYPVIWLVVGLVHLITRPLRGDTGDGDPEEAASQELQSIIETAEDEDVLDEDRSELLRSALDFSDISASEAMTARVDMVAIDIDDDWDEILRVIDESTYSRLPVYSDSVDNIIGFLYLNRFFKAMMDGRPGGSARAAHPAVLCLQDHAPARRAGKAPPRAEAPRRRHGRIRRHARRHHDGGRARGARRRPSGMRPTRSSARSLHAPTAGMSSTAT